MEESLVEAGDARAQALQAAEHAHGLRQATELREGVERELFDQWSAAVFYDAGSAMNSFTDLQMKEGAGVGIRWNAPFGQVRLDLARAIDDGGNSWRVHLTLGADL